MHVFIGQFQLYSFEGLNILNYNPHPNPHPHPPSLVFLVIFLVNYLDYSPINENTVEGTAGTLSLNPHSHDSKLNNFSVWCNFATVLIALLLQIIASRLYSNSDYKDNSSSTDSTVELADDEVHIINSCEQENQGETELFIN